MLPVGDNCVQVKDFLEKKRNRDGDGDIQRLFYEFTGDEEDLDSFREVVTATSNVRHSLFMLHRSLREHLYIISMACVININFIIIV